MIYVLAKKNQEVRVRSPLHPTGDRVRILWFYLTALLLMLLINYLATFNRRSKKPAPITPRPTKLVVFEDSGT